MIEATRMMLTAWGRWARRHGKTGGYPRASAFTRANSGGRAKDTDDDYPDDLQAIERAVARSPAEYRRLLHISYIHSDSRADGARMAGLWPSTYRRRVERAEEHIDRVLAAM